MRKEINEHSSGIFCTTDCEPLVKSGRTFWRAGCIYKQGIRNRTLDVQGRLDIIDHCSDRMAIAHIGTVDIGSAHAEEERILLLNVLLRSNGQRKEQAGNNQYFSERHYLRFLITIHTWDITPRPSNRHDKRFRAKLCRIIGKTTYFLEFSTYFPTIKHIYLLLSITLARNSTYLTPKHKKSPKTFTSSGRINLCMLLFQQLVKQSAERLFVYYASVHELAVSYDECSWEAAEVVKRDVWRV